MLSLPLDTVKPKHLQPFLQLADSMCRGLYPSRFSLFATSTFCKWLMLQ